MKTLNLYLIESLSNDNIKILINKELNKEYIYQYENPFNEGGIWVLYDAVLDKKCNFVKGKVHKMSELIINVLPLTNIKY